ncbi:MAG: AMP-binding protein, partial [Arcobacter sp.]|nr:AMP-binding protein [Arcobacter sp.]
LSHRNILANIKQISEMLNITDEEVFLGSLPSFNSFGFTVTTMLPILEGIKLAFHPDPTDAFGIGKVVAKNRVTFICSSSNLLNLYLENTKLTPLMFESLKMVFVGFDGADKSLGDKFFKTFGVRIYEGYGMRECCSVISSNIPDNLDMNYWQIQIGTKKQTVGMPLCGCVVRIVDTANMKEVAPNEAGQILVSGSNVMVGYLNDIEKTNEVFVLLDGQLWYKTGDVGHIDEDGFLTIIKS